MDHRLYKVHLNTHNMETVRLAEANTQRVQTHATCGANGIEGKSLNHYSNDVEGSFRR